MVLPSITNINQKALWPSSTLAPYGLWRLFHTINIAYMWTFANVV